MQKWGNGPGFKSLPVSFISYPSCMFPSNFVLFFCSVSTFVSFLFFTCSLFVLFLGVRRRVQFSTLHYTTLKCSAGRLFVVYSCMFLLVLCC